MSASFVTLSIASYASVVGTPAGIAGSSLTLIFTIGTGIKYVYYLYIKYAFVVLLKEKKGISATNGFNKMIKQSGRKPNKIRVDQESEFYNHVFKRWLSRNNIIMYSTYNEGKSVVAERFIRTLKNKLYKHMTATGKNVYYDVLDDIVNEYKILSIILLK